MNLRYHKTLTLEKWKGFTFTKQILMIANELNRAGNWIEKKDYTESKLCYERAFELLYLTIASLKGKNRLRELLRFKEMLAKLYISDVPAIRQNSDLLKTLISLDKDSYRMLTVSSEQSREAGSRFN